MPPMKVLAFAVGTTAQIDRPTDTGLLKCSRTRFYVGVETRDNARGSRTYYIVLQMARS